MRVRNINAYLIYSKNYKESSSLLTVYSDTFGKITVLGKGIRNFKSKIKSALSLFSYLNLNIIPPKKSGGIYILTSVEKIYVANNFLSLNYENQLVLHYITELIYLLVPYEEEDHIIFSMYNSSIQEATNRNIKNILRQFELCLLKSLGYEVDFYYDTNGDELINFQYYSYFPLEGFSLSRSENRKCDKNIFLGNIINNISMGEGFWGGAEFSALQRIMRANIQKLLLGRKLNTREALLSYYKLIDKN